MLPTSRDQGTRGSGLGARAPSRPKQGAVSTPGRPDERYPTRDTRCETPDARRVKAWHSAELDPPPKGGWTLDHPLQRVVILREVTSERPEGVEGFPRPSGA